MSACICGCDVLRHSFCAAESSAGDKHIIFTEICDDVRWETRRPAWRCWVAGLLKMCVGNVACLGWMCAALSTCFEFADALLPEMCAGYADRHGRERTKFSGLRRGSMVEDVGCAGGLNQRRTIADEYCVSPWLCEALDLACAAVAAHRSRYRFRRNRFEKGSEGWDPAHCSTGIERDALSYWSWRLNSTQVAEPRVIG